MAFNFRRKLLAREKLVGTILSLPSPEVAEIYSLQGFDWLFLDLEHGLIDISDAQRIIQASGVPCVVRCPANDEIWIKKCLDIGAEGIIIPQVKSPEDVHHLIQLSQYPPEGIRSVGIARAHGYGLNFADYVAQANQKIAKIIQIEHITAVDNITEILAVSGIDCVFIGPYDLSASMGLVGNIEHPDVVEAINKVTTKCMEANIPLGIFSSSTEGITDYIKLGYSLLAVGMDSLFLGHAASAVIKALK
ncbi:aldolase/citrate lyase family protein [uncultured Shewanella sp.]|uniref:HpcH/HpaI aldolase family protein n=1 Tax=uncultured Shewanella sp. TaxID=173975 RepID=UPI00262CE89A|nr:aldolase/citrate lyase family protein [uncultured Shewanella sp.]